MTDAPETQSFHPPARDHAPRPALPHKSTWKSTARFERQPMLKQQWLIGTGGDCDLQINCAYVSRHHCRLTKIDALYLLEDLGSRNGTLVNGKWLQFISRRVPHNLSAAIHPEDVLQQTYLKAFRSIEAFEPRTEHSFYAWLKVIAQRQLLDEVRRYAKDPLGLTAQRRAPRQAATSSTLLGVSQFLEDHGMLPKEAARRQELLRAMQVALATLEPRYAAAIQLRYFQDYSKERVAAELDVGVDALRGILFRARKKLKESIGRLSVYI